MINIETQQEAILLEWAEKVMLRTNYSNMQEYAEKALAPVGGLTVFECTAQLKDCKGIKLIKNPFWKRVVTT